jgi:hypothetical protein
MRFYQNIGVKKMTRVIEKDVLIEIAKFFKDPSFCHELKQKKIMRILVRTLPPKRPEIGLDLKVINYNYSEFEFCLIEEKPRFTARCQQLDLEIKFD